MLRRPVLLLTQPDTFRRRINLARFSPTTTKPWGNVSNSALQVWTTVSIELPDCIWGFPHVIGLAESWVPWVRLSPYWLLKKFHRHLFNGVWSRHSSLNWTHKNPLSVRLSQGQWDNQSNYSKTTLARVSSGLIRLETGVIPTDFFPQHLHCAPLAVPHLLPTEFFLLWDKIREVWGKKSQSSEGRAKNGCLPPTDPTRLGGSGNEKLPAVRSWEGIESSEASKFPRRTGIRQKYTNGIWSSGNTQYLLETHHQNDQNNFMVCTKANSWKLVVGRSISALSCKMRFLEEAKEWRGGDTIQLSRSVSTGVLYR